MIGPAAWGSAVGAAAVVAARGTAAAVGGGLSFAAELLKAAGGEAPAAQTDSAAARWLDDFTQRASALAERIRRHLAAAGIELSQPLELTSDGLGGIALAWPHPQQAQIEEVLSRDMHLARDFNHLRREHDERAASDALLDRPQPWTLRIEPSDHVGPYPR